MDTVRNFEKYERGDSKFSGKKIEKKCDKPLEKNNSKFEEQKSEENKSIILIH